MKNHNGNYAKIVTIGSGNIEYVMQLGGEFRIGKKIKWIPRNFWEEVVSIIRCD